MQQIRRHLIGNEHLLHFQACLSLRRSQMDDFVNLRQVITTIVKWWWLLILTTIIAAVIGYAISQRQPPVFQAATTIIVGQSIQATELDRNDIQTSESLASTYANIARRQPVLQSVVDRLSLTDTWKQLKSRVTVKPVSDTQLLEIVVEANSPEEAQVTADEVAHQLILQSPTALRNQEADANQQFVRQRLESLQTKIEAGQARLETLDASMSGSLSAEQVQEIQSETNALETLIADWENNYTQLLVFVEGKKSANYLAVIEPAQADLRPVRPRIFLNTLLAGVVGLLLALGLIFLIEYLDDRLKSTTDLTQVLGLTTLGSIGQIKGKNPAGRLITAQDAFSPSTEAYRMIRSNIQFMSVDRPTKAIMVTSPVPGEGKSTTTANLGVVMAQAGLRTIIVDADFRRPSQHNIFQTSKHQLLMGGMTDLLCTPEAEIRNYLRDTGVENLQLITSGALPPNPAELLASKRMGQVVSSLTALADLVIVDCPPAAVVTDAVVLSTIVDGVIMVIEAGKTRQGVAKQAVINLQRAEARLLGAVLNRASANNGGYYYQSYYASPRSSSHRQPKPGTNHSEPRRRWQWLPFFR